MEITIIYGSETGNCENLAHQAKSFFEKSDMSAKVLDMEEVTASKLTNFENLLVITSTWGDGEPPCNAQGLYDELKGSSNVDLSGTRYAVFAIGQSFYDNFCKTGKDFDGFLSKLGGKMLCDIELSDDDFDDTFLPWLEKIKAIIS